jgi:transposase
MAPLEVREARRLVRMRAALVRVRTRLKCQIHAVLAEHGVLPEKTDLFGPGGRRQLAALQLPEISQNRIDANLRLIDVIAGEVEIADRELLARLAADPRVRRLLPIPGVGFTTAVTIVTEVWDVSRSTTPDRLCSWPGLAPTERSSAGQTRRGHISEQGSRWLRLVMVETGCHSLRKYGFGDSEGLHVNPSPPWTSTAS